MSGSTAYLRKVLAIVWLHLVRLHRYKLGFMNMILTDMIWYILLTLGALAFSPAGSHSVTAVIIFWGIVMWSIMNNTIWLIVGWVRFVLAWRIFEDHILHNTNPILLISGRIITSTIVTAMAVPVIAIAFYFLTGAPIIFVKNIGLMVLGIVLLIIYAALYSMVLVCLSLRLRIPGAMLDITNIAMFVIGGLGVPLAWMAPIIRNIAFFIPYTYAAEIARAGIAGIEPYFGLTDTLSIGGIYMAIILLTTIVVIKYSIGYIRKHGVKGVGMM